MGDEPIRGLENGAQYYVTVIDANTIRLAESQAEAFNALPIDLVTVMKLPTNTPEVSMRWARISTSPHLMDPTF